MKISYSYKDETIPYAQVAHELAIEYAKLEYQRKIDRLTAKTDNPENEPFLKESNFRERMSHFLGLYNEFISYAEHIAPEK